jgi:hypothetical protein
MNQEQKKPKAKPGQRERLEKSLEAGIQCSYARFQAAVAPKENKEPVHEFKLNSTDVRYKVDKISHDNHTLFWKIDGIIQETPWVNVQWARPILD